MYLSITTAIKTDCSNYRHIAFANYVQNFIQYRVVKVTPTAEESIWDHQCEYRRNRSSTDHMVCIRQMLEKKCEYNEAVHQLLIDFKKAYDSVRREVLYNIPIEFGIPMKLVRLIKMCVTETLSRLRAGKHLSDMFPIRNGLKQRDALSPLLVNFAIGHAVRRVPVNQDGLKLNVTHQLLAYADYVNILGGSVHTTKKNAEALVVASK